MSDLRRATLNSRCDISSENRSSASSTATASKCRTTAVSIAVFFGSWTRARCGALLPSPYRASDASRFGGTRSSRTLRSLNAAISFTRSIAFTIAVPVERFGGRRITSSRENHSPSGTSSSATKSPGSCASARWAAFATVACSRRSAASRTVATSRTSR